METGSKTLSTYFDGSYFSFSDTGERKSLMKCFGVRPGMASDVMTSTKGDTALRAIIDNIAIEHRGNTERIARLTPKELQEVVDKYRMHHLMYRELLKLTMPFKGIDQLKAKYLKLDDQDFADDTGDIALSTFVCEEQDLKSQGYKTLCEYTMRVNNDGDIINLALNSEGENIVTIMIDLGFGSTHAVIDNDYITGHKRINRLVRDNRQVTEHIPKLKTLSRINNSQGAGNSSVFSEIHGMGIAKGLMKFYIDPGIDRIPEGRHVYTWALYNLRKELTA